MTLILCHVSLLPPEMHIVHTLEGCSSCVFAVGNVETVWVLNGCLRDWLLWSGFNAPAVSWESATLSSRYVPAQLGSAHLEIEGIEHCTGLSTGLSAGCRGDWRFPTYLWLVA